MPAFLRRVFHIALLPACFACLWVNATAKQAGVDAAQGSWLDAFGLKRTGNPYVHPTPEFEALVARLQRAEADRLAEADDADDAGLPQTDPPEATADAS